MTELCLHTQRLLLRDMRLEDEKDFVALSQQPGYQTYYDEADGRPEHYRFLTQLFVEQAAQLPRTAYQMAVVEAAASTFIGVACLRLEGEGQASIGFGLHPSWQGRGLMQEAMQTLLTFSADKLGARYWYAETLQQNQAAVAVCQALGFKLASCAHSSRYFKGRYWQPVTLEKRLAE